MDEIRTLSVDVQPIYSALLRSHTLLPATNAADFFVALMCPT